MSERKISYLNRTFEDYKDALVAFAKEYYPTLFDELDDSAIGTWLIEMVASICDNLSFHIDRVYSETCIDTATMKSSVYSIARTNGFKIPGPKGAMAEVEFSCDIPVSSVYSNDSSTSGMPNWFFAPIIKKGTKLSGKGQYFEVMDDIDFSEQFDSNGVSNRTVTPVRNANGNITKYVVTKRDVVVAGESKIYKQVINQKDVKPFMEFVIPSLNVMNVESIIFKDGIDYNVEPTMSEFMIDKEFVPAQNSVSKSDTYRFFEVDSLLQQYRWGDDISNFEDGNQDTAKAETYDFGYYNAEKDATIPSSHITKGKWKPLTQKFVTEYTDAGYLKVSFGSGEQVGQDVDDSCANDFSRYQISRMVRNNFLGKLPKGGWTMYILYRVGGGAASNLPAGTINTISYLNTDIGRCLTSQDDRKLAAAVMNSIKVRNTIPSVSGKDAPTVDELKAMIKYNNAAQNRCVTVKDYVSRIENMPARYGCPFRVSAIEENNKVMVYLLGVDYLGKLSAVLPNTMVTNIQNYLSKYRSINDYVEIKSGRIINLSFEIDIFVDKNYNVGDVVKNVIRTVKDYMDINKHELGEDIYVGDIQKEVGKIDGVLNLIDMRVYNEIGDTYSQTQTTQETIGTTYEDEGGYEYIEESNRLQIDLEASDYVLNSDYDTMYEIKYPDVTDIKVRVKTR